MRNAIAWRRSAGTTTEGVLHAWRGRVVLPYPAHPARRFSRFGLKTLHGHYLLPWSPRCWLTTGCTGACSMRGAGNRAATIPSIYREGYEKARAKDPELADAYIRHTTLGDPLADRAAEDLASPDSDHGAIRSALDRHEDPSVDVPRSLRDLVESASVVPHWFDPGFAHVATRAFFRNPEVILAALATGAIIEGFSTLISRSFFIRGRILENGVRRLSQNNLHLFEQFLPDSLLPGGDGWRLNLRIRLVHARTRHLIRSSEEWDTAMLGMPVSAAHVLLGAASFSGRLMQHVERLGGGFSREEREAYVHVWRYSGCLLGIPEAIMFDDEASAVRAFEIGRLCEPPPDEYGIIMANCLLNSVPLVLGVDDPTVRKSETAKYYEISRALIGNELADQFKFPRPQVIPLLPILRAKYRSWRLLRRLFPTWAALRSFGSFAVLLRASNLQTYELDYRLPSALREEDSRRW